MGACAVRGGAHRQARRQGGGIVAKLDFREVGQARGVVAVFEMPNTTPNTLDAHRLMPGSERPDEAIGALQELGGDGLLGLLSARDSR